MNSQAVTLGYTVVDLTVDARLQDSTNTTYFNADQTHLNDMGSPILAGVYKAAYHPSIAT